MPHEPNRPNRHDHFAFVDDENPAEEWLDRLDYVLTQLYTERGSFAAALAEIGDSMDWLVKSYAQDGKPWLQSAGTARQCHRIAMRAAP